MAILHVLLTSGEVDQDLTLLVLSLSYLADRCSLTKRSDAMMNSFAFIIAVMDVMIGLTLIFKKTTTRGLDKASLRFVGWLIFLCGLLVLFCLLICSFRGGGYGWWQVLIHAGLGAYGIVVMKVLR